MKGINWLIYEKDYLVCHLPNKSKLHIVQLHVVEKYMDIAYINWIFDAENYSRVENIWGNTVTNSWKIAQHFLFSKENNIFLWILATNDISLFLKNVYKQFMKKKKT